MRTSAIRSPVFGSTASGRCPRWKQKSLPCTWYDGRPSSETSFVTCGIARASLSRSAMVATTALCQVDSTRRRTDDRATKNANLTTVGAVCAVFTTLAFVVGIVLMTSSGVQVLIPETGQNGLDWIRDVDDAGGQFLAGGWLVVTGGLFALVALIGFYEPLRRAHPLLILGPILSVVGFVFVTISHALPLALAYEFVPGYVDAGPVTQASLRVDFDTWAITCLVFNYIGDVLVWAIVVPLYAWASLRTRAVPRWIGWFGLATGVLAGWLGLLSPVSSVIDGITFLGFVGFFVWIAAMGIALLRRRPATEELAPVTAQG